MAGGLAFGTFSGTRAGAMSQWWSICLAFLGAEVHSGVEQNDKRCWLGKKLKQKFGDGLEVGTTSGKDLGLEQEDILEGTGVRSGFREGGG